MADSSRAPSQLILDDHPRLGRMRVDMEAFFEFSFWIAEELEDMKAQVLHRQGLSAPTKVGLQREDALRGNHHRSG